MLCELCESPTRVRRTIKAGGARGGLGLTKAKGLVAWYAPTSFVARHRACSCGHEFLTVEVVSNDLDEMLLTVSRNGLAVTSTAE